MAPDPRSVALRPGDLNRLMDALEVDFVFLAQCLVSPGWGLSFGSLMSPGLHYNLSGHGLMVVADGPPIALGPNTLVVVPMGMPFRLEAPGADAHSPVRIVEHVVEELAPGHLHRFVAGQSTTPLDLVCGYFRAGFGAGIDPFATLRTVLVEKLDTGSPVGALLNAAREELVAEQVGFAAMTATLLKQVLLILLRRSLETPGLWTERFSALSDPQVARALGEMLAHPGDAHTLGSLARRAALSRSAFMSRFTSLFNVTPMTALRRLRMERAALLLVPGNLSIEQVAQEVGYVSRSSFIRAFRHHHGVSPVAKRPKLPDKV